MTNQYEQLQEFLNKCIEMWWKPRGFDWNCFKYFTCDSEWWGSLCNGDWFSYHDLFSVDSGLMSFVKRDKENQEGDELFKKGKAYYANIEMRMMWPMTKEEKIKYFLENALFPTQD